MTAVQSALAAPALATRPADAEPGVGQARRGGPAEDGSAARAATPRRAASASRDSAPSHRRGRGASRSATSRSASSYRSTSRPSRSRTGSRRARSSERQRNRGARRAHRRRPRPRGRHVRDSRSKQFGRQCRRTAPVRGGSAGATTPNPESTDARRGASGTATFGRFASAAASAADTFAVARNLPPPAELAPSRPTGRCAGGKRIASEVCQDGPWYGRRNDAMSMRCFRNRSIVRDRVAGRAQDAVHPCPCRPRLRAQSHDPDYGRSSRESGPSRSYCDRRPCRRVRQSLCNQSFCAQSARGHSCRRCIRTEFPCRSRCAVVWTPGKQASSQGAVGMNGSSHGGLLPHAAASLCTAQWAEVGRCVVCHHPRLRKRAVACPTRSAASLCMNMYCGRHAIAVAGSQISDGACGGRACMCVRTPGCIAIVMDPSHALAAPFGDFHHDANLAICFVRICPRPRPNALQTITASTGSLELATCPMGPSKSEQRGMWPHGRWGWCGSGGRAASGFRGDSGILGPLGMSGVDVGFLSRRATHARPPALPLVRITPPALPR